MFRISGGLKLERLKLEILVEDYDTGSPSSMLGWNTLLFNSDQELCVES